MFASVPNVGGLVDESQKDYPRRIGPYEIAGVLGIGGMGRVCLGRAEDGRLVAVKVVHDDLARDPQFRRRLAREVEATRKVNTLGVPHIAILIDADVEADPPWLATEYVPADSLHTVVTRNGPLPADEVRELGIVLATALAAVHDAGLIHRDVKPPNILIADDGPKLIDFGIARDTAVSTMTRTGIVLGTPQVMAPEQLEGRRGQVGPASDVFALGTVLAFATTGDYPFGDGNLQALSYRIVHEEPNLDAVPAPLRALLVRCLAKDPDDRPTAAGVVAALTSSDTHITEPHAEPGSEPGLGTTPEPSTRRWRWPAIVGVGAALSVLAIGWLAVESFSGSAKAQGGTAITATSHPPTSDSSSDAPPTSRSPLAGCSSCPASHSPSPSGTTTPDAVGSPTGPPTTTTTATTTSGPATVVVMTTSGPKPPTTASSSPAGHPTIPTTTAPANVPPASPPGGLKFTQYPSRSYQYGTISWDAVPGATSYDVTITTAFTPQERTIGVNDTSFSDNVFPGDNLCYVIRSVNAYGASAPGSKQCFQNGT